MKKSSEHSPAICDVCLAAPARYTCPVCGRSVCENDWSGDACIVCSEARCRVCGVELAVASCNVCGSPVCESCSIQVNPVVRVCKQCSRKLNIAVEQWPPRSLVLAELRRLGSSLGKILRA